jgi:hypothetical protein
VESMASRLTNDTRGVEEELLARWAERSRGQKRDFGGVAVPGLRPSLGERTPLRGSHPLVFAEEVVAPFPKELRRGAPSVILSGAKNLPNLPRFFAPLRMTWQASVPGRCPGLLCVSLSGSKHQ